MTDDDIASVISGCADWRELARFGPPYWRPRSPAELRRKIAATAGPQPGAEYSFVLADGDRLVGECSLHGIDLRNGFAQVGVCVWDPADRRHGYGTTAVEFLMDWGRGYLGLARLEAWIVDGNEPSLALFKRLGFTHEATLQGRYLYAGVRRAMHILALSARLPDSV
ncbi:GNAT family N-acetyltransferase [Mycolicibacterium peregrinum]|uniref:GNAT family N-acetyltransferase n=1 Tax=Mycolicibacterium peregrinum TaxID=43304 RepID=UPI003AAA9FE9